MIVQLSPQLSAIKLRFPFGAKKPPLWWFFHFYLSENPLMKTTIYIDGFNLYYGVVRGTPCKWLDVVSLFSALCNEQNSNVEVVKVKFFTAPIKAKLSTRKQQAEHSQRIYIKALQNKYPELFYCEEGFYQLSKGLFPKYQVPIDKRDKISVWRLEEKQTDVNIALNLYRDAVQGNTEQVILISGDSDLTPALELIKVDCPTVKIGVIFPKPYNIRKEGRITNKGLEAVADWTRGYIKNNELEEHQLPNKIPTNKKPLCKPNYW